MAKYTASERASSGVRWDVTSPCPAAWVRLGPHGELESFLQGVTGTGSLTGRQGTASCMVIISAVLIALSIPLPQVLIQADGHGY